MAVRATMQTNLIPRVRLLILISKDLRYPCRIIDEQSHPRYENSSRLWSHRP